MKITRYTFCSRILVHQSPFVYTRNYTLDSFSPATIETIKSNFRLSRKGVLTIFQIPRIQQHLLGVTNNDIRSRSYKSNNVLLKVVRLRIYERCCKQVALEWFRRVWNSMKELRH